MARPSKLSPDQVVERGLTEKQSAFVREYLIDLNATQAAIRAGYSAKSAEWIGPQLLGKTHVAEAVTAAMRARQQRTEITQDRVLQELARLAFFDAGKMFGANGEPLPLHSLDEDTRRAVVGLDVVTVGNADAGLGQVQKIKLADKLGALEKLGRHLGLFTDRVELTGKGGGPIQSALDVSGLSIEAMQEIMRAKDASVVR